MKKSNEKTFEMILVVIVLYVLIYPLYWLSMLILGLQYIPGSLTGCLPYEVLTCTYLKKRKEGWLCVGTGASLSLIQGIKRRKTYLIQAFLADRIKAISRLTPFVQRGKGENIFKDKNRCEAERWQLDHQVVSWMHVQVAVGQTLSGPKAEKHIKTCSADDKSELMMWRHALVLRCSVCRSCMNSIFATGTAAIACYCHIPPHHRHCSLKRVANVMVFVD